VREHTDGNIFKPDFKMYLFEPLPEIKVDEWWNPSDVIDLGNRKLEVVHLPGHTDTHIALIDRERRLVFSGDLIYTKPAALDPIFDGENLADYYESVKKLLSMTDDSYTFLCGHTTVRLGYSDLAALGDTFYSIFEEGNQGTESLMLFRVFNVVEGKIDLMVRAEDLPSQEPSELIN
jgi:glyoxylase-like metal-dependent hydrolase (beta-lactamase superfamily II)